MEDRQNKRDAVLEAAIAEFTAKGYDLASTNAIAEKAGVSKGIIFHYFGSKKDLFLTVVDCALDRFLAEYEKVVGQLPADPIEHLIQRMRAKKQIAVNLSKETELLRRAWLPIPRGLEQEMRNRAQKVGQIQNDRLWSYTEFGKLKPGIDPGIARMLIDACVDGLMRLYSSRVMELGDHWQAGLDAWSVDVRRCLTLLRTALYETEEN